MNFEGLEWLSKEDEIIIPTLFQCVFLHKDSGGSKESFVSLARVAWDKIESAPKEFRGMLNEWFKDSLEESRKKRHEKQS